MGDDTTKKKYQQPGARETEQFWNKIWHSKKHSEKPEWINNRTKELDGLEEGPKAKIHIDSLKTTLEKIKLENAWPRRNTWLLVKDTGIIK